MIDLIHYKKILLFLENSDISEYAIKIGTPILYFGNINKAKVATLGINPSNKEFYDNNNNELSGDTRRFHTLASLGLDKWGNITDDDYSRILASFDNYFAGNPYNIWFKHLDYLLSGCEISYYFPYNNAVHLDLSPIATESKWSDIPAAVRKMMLDSGAEILTKLINESPIETIILNGQTIIKYVEALSGISFQPIYKKSLDIPRSNGNVKGVVYKHKISKIGNKYLDREITFLGYNHNIQSSFGISKQIKDNIKQWITTEIKL